MQLCALLLLLLVRSSSLRMLNSHTSKLYFQLLQSSAEGLVPDNTGRRRPVASDQLPLVDLVEEEDALRDPRASDINVTQLRQQLGAALDTQFMSLEKPRRPADKLPGQFIHGRPKGRRPHFLRLLRSSRRQDGRKMRLNVPKNVRRKFQKFMWNLTFCPVRHSWKFLGPRVWPQWIKEGSCYSKRSCSMPPGMTCKQRTHTYKTFLRWHCDDFQRRQHCRWIEFMYPIITGCSCSC